MIQETFFSPGSMSGRERIQAGMSPHQGTYILVIIVSSTDCFKKKEVIVVSPMQRRKMLTSSGNKENIADLKCNILHFKLSWKNCNIFTLFYWSFKSK